MPTATSKGKPAIWKLLLLVHVVKSVLLNAPSSRATLIPYIVRWCKPHLGRFDERGQMSPKESDAMRDNARISWLEGNRLAVSVVAALSDRLHSALADPTVRASRSLLAQEQDNAEYVLSLLSRLLDTYRSLESATNFEILTRSRAVAVSVPTVFPASYPFSLLTLPPPSAGEPETPAIRIAHPSQATLATVSGETAAATLAILHTAPPKILTNFLESAFEVEGKDNFGRFLGNLFRFCLSILEGAAWTSSWLNISIFAHRVILGLAEPAAVILEREYIPPQHLSYTFNFALWRDYFAMLLRLLASEQLVIEEFSSQKRRAIWRRECSLPAHRTLSYHLAVAGDLRGRGAKVLLRLWEALGWPEATSGKPASMSRLGGLPNTGAVRLLSLVALLIIRQLGPGLVEPNLELCLSHHDELRSNAVLVLYSLIINEWNLNEDFSSIQTEIIDRLDKLFNARKRDDVSPSRCKFVSHCS